MKYERGSFIVVPSREKLRGMPVPAQALYMWLCAYANEDGECYPSRARLASDLDCTLPTVDRFTQLLVDRGLLSVEKRTKNGENMTNLYSVVIWGGSKADLPPSKQDLQGVVKDVDKELYPIVTKPTELLEVKDTEGSPKRLKYSEMRGFATDRVGAILVAGEKLAGGKYPDKRAQQTAISRCLESGYTEQQILTKFESLLDDKFWGEKGVDFKIVLSQIGKAVRAPKVDAKLKDKYAKYA
jgi:hypothetical protein